MSEPENTEDMRPEVERIKRVSDMLVSAHYHLREKYGGFAAILDVAILLISVWLTAVVFIEPKISLKLTPFHLDPVIWVGLLGVMALSLSILQLRVDWKGRSAAHARSAEMYSKIKGQCRQLLESKHAMSKSSCGQLFTRYEMSSELGCSIPEGEFLKEKRRHLVKVAISKHLDTHPSASLTLLRLRMWWRSNITGRGGLL